MKRWFTKLVLSGMAKAGDCPDHSKMAATLLRKKRVRAVLEEV